MTTQLATALHCSLLFCVPCAERRWSDHFYRICIWIFIFHFMYAHRKTTINRRQQKLFTFEWFYLSSRLLPFIRNFNLFRCICSLVDCISAKSSSVLAAYAKFRFPHSITIFLSKSKRWIAVLLLLCLRSTNSNEFSRAAYCFWNRMNMEKKKNRLVECIFWLNVVHDQIDAEEI